MSKTLRKADGDLFIDRETGRPEIAEGPTKVSQELADLYMTYFDSTRAWGSELDPRYFNTALQASALRAVLFLKVQQANARILAKQLRDPYLDQDSEKIQAFSVVDVDYDSQTQTGIFISVADVGTEAVSKIIGLDFKPVSLRNVVPPPIAVVPES